MNDALRIVCPHCDRANRVPPAALALAARCAACHRSLFEGRPIAVDPLRLQHHVTRNDIPVLIGVWAADSAPGRNLAPQFERATRRLEPRLRSIRLDAEAAPALVRRLGIERLPTLALFSRGREIARLSGVMKASAITAWISGVLV